MGRLLIGLALSALSWGCFWQYEHSLQWAAWLPFLLPPLALLAFRDARTPQWIILAALLLFLLLDADILLRVQQHRGEAVLLDYMLHFGFAALCLLAILLSWIWRRFARRPK